MGLARTVTLDRPLFQDGSVGDADMTAGGALRHRTVGEVVAEDYARASTFRQFGIDFCCGGDRTVEDACGRSGVAVEEVEAAILASTERAGRGWPDVRAWDAAFLAQYIVQVHHQYVREALPTLLQFSQKVAKVHGDGRPELSSIRALVIELSIEMVRHIDEEEADVFPQVAAFVAGREEERSGTEVELWSAIGKLEADHDHAGEIMAQIRELSDGYAPPITACATYRALYAKLAEFEEDLHRHVHLENNVLFPKVAELAQDALPT